MTDKPEPFYAHRVIRAMTKTCAAMEIGAQGFALISMVAHQWDTVRYAYPVAYHRENIMLILGIDHVTTFRRIEQRCLASGWLCKRVTGRRRPSVYWVSIPARYSDIHDTPSSDNDVSPTVSPTVSTPVSLCVSTCVSQPVSPSVSPFIPLPLPSPIPKKESETLSKKSVDETPAPSKPIPSAQDLFTPEGASQPAPGIDPSSRRSAGAVEWKFQEPLLAAEGVVMKPWTAGIWPGVIKRLGGIDFTCQVLRGMEPEPRSDPAKVETAGRGVYAARRKADKKAAEDSKRMAASTQTQADQTEAIATYRDYRRHFLAMSDDRRAEIIMEADPKAQGYLRAMSSARDPANATLAVYLLKSVEGLRAREESA